MLQSSNLHDVTRNLVGLGSLKWQENEPASQPASLPVRAGRPGGNLSSGSSSLEDGQKPAELSRLSGRLDKGRYGRDEVWRMKHLSLKVFLAFFPFFFLEWVHARIFPSKCILRSSSRIVKVCALDHYRVSNCLFSIFFPFNNLVQLILEKPLGTHSRLLLELSIFLAFAHKMWPYLRQGCLSYMGGCIFSCLAHTNTLISGTIVRSVPLPLRKANSRRVTSYESKIWAIKGAKFAPCKRGLNALLEVT